MLEIMTLIFAWLPPIIQVLFAGILVIFIVIVIVRLIILILDLIPFA